MKLYHLLISMLFFQAAAGQANDEIRKNFPASDMVYQTYDQELRIIIKDDVPVAERKTNLDMLMLTDKNINMLSRYRVYHSGYSELTELEAYTRVPAGNKFKTIKVGEKKVSNSSTNSIFYDDSKETAFDFPALSQNAIAHVEYTQFHKDAHLLTGFYVPSYMPVINGSFTLIVPDDVKIKYIVKNDPRGLFQFTKDSKKRETHYRWSFTNYKAEDRFSNAPDPRYYQPHIIFYISSYTNDKGEQPFLNSIDDLYKWNYSFIKDLNKSDDNELKKIVDSVITKGQSEKTKAEILYKWVQQHIKYVAFEDGLEGFRPRQASEVCSKRYGDCKDMSSILTQMLRIAGLKAYYTWIGTRDLPYTYTETPLPIVDNHMITTVLINDKWYFLDATDPNSTLDMQPASLQDKEALVSLSEKEYKLVRVPVITPEQNLIVDSTFISISDEGVTGNQVVRYEGYFGKDVYTSLLYKDEKETKEYVNSRMSKGSNKFILKKYDIVRSSPAQNIAHINADFEIPGYSKQVDKEYYINLNLEKLLENQVIDTAKRKTPMEIDFNYLIKSYHILDIPKGYKLSYLPENYSFENNLIKVNIYYTVELERIIAAQEVQHKKLNIQPSEFEEWNKPMKAILPYYKQSVVLEKK